MIDDFAWRLDKTGLRNQLVSTWVASVDDGEARRVTDPAWEVLDARWLPDGRHIAVVADAEPDAGVRRLSERAAAWRIHGDKSAEPVALAELPGGIAAVRPSPDGKRVAVIGKDYPRQPSWADSHLYVGDGTSLALSTTVGAASMPAGDWKPESSASGVDSAISVSSVPMACCGGTTDGNGVTRPCAASSSKRIAEVLQKFAQATGDSSLVSAG